MPTDMPLSSIRKKIKLIGLAAAAGWIYMVEINSTALQPFYVIFVVPTKRIPSFRPFWLLRRVLASGVGRNGRLRLMSRQLEV